MGPKEREIQSRLRELEHAETRADESAPLLHLGRSQNGHL